MHDKEYCLDTFAPNAIMFHTVGEELQYYIYRVWTNDEFDIFLRSFDACAILVLETGVWCL